MPRKPTQKAAEATGTVLLDGNTWEVAAWRLWTEEGRTNVASLTKALQAEFPDAPKDARTVRKGIDRVADAVSVVLRSNCPNAEAVFVARQESLFRKALDQARTADNANATIGALKLAAELSKQIASCLGVVTERRGVLLGEDTEHPFHWWEAVADAVKQAE